MIDPAVTLTDYLLTVECTLFAWLLARGATPRSAAQRWFVAFFAALALASAAGGTAHGFIADKTTAAHAVVWTGALLAIGLAALAGWHIGAHLVLAPAAARRLGLAAIGVYAVYAAVLLFVSRSFAVAVAHYLPAALFLFAAFWLAQRRHPAPPLQWGALGMGLTFAAAAVQASGTTLHPEHLNHNVLYHLIQAVALFYIFRAARGLAHAAPDC
jgi:hypothetical protein